jgi:hypothetical protein
MTQVAEGSAVMNWALPLRHDLFRMTAKDDRNMRSIVLHFEPGTTNVDGFACSACDWFHFFTTTEPDGTLPRPEVDLGHKRYAEHDCADFPKLRNGSGMP